MAIAVQSPYVAQVQLLRERLDDFPVADGVEVATIDSFQGREADAVIISMVHYSPTVTFCSIAYSFYFILPSPKDDSCSSLLLLYRYGPTT